MSAKPKQPQPDTQQQDVVSETKLILSQSEHAKLSVKEQLEFRAKGGTVSNQE